MDGRSKAIRPHIAYKCIQLRSSHCKLVYGHLRKFLRILIETVNNFSLHLLQGLYNSYLFGDLNFTCAPINYTTSPQMSNIILVTYIYYVMKLVDLIDTVNVFIMFNLKVDLLFAIFQVFFVLRKKTSQISFLHVYHHAGMVFASYVCSKFIPGELLMK